MSETLSKIYLELSKVVPEGTVTEQEIALRHENRQMKQVLYSLLRSMPGKKVFIDPRMCPAGVEARVVVRMRPDHRQAIEAKIVLEPSEPRIILEPQELKIPPLTLTCQKCRMEIPAPAAIAKGWWLCPDCNTKP